MENRNGLVVNAMLTQASGTGEREAALLMLGLLRKTRHRGLKLVGWIFKFATAVYNLVRIRNLAEVT